MSFKRFFEARPFAMGLAVLFGMFASVAAYAHVKWFIDLDNINVVNFEPYSFSDTAVQVWIAVGIVVVGLSIFLDSRVPSPPIVNSKIRHDFIEILRVCTGMSFLLVAYEGNIIAPHLSAHGVLGGIFVVLQALIGIILLSNHFIQQAGMLICLLFLGLIIQFGFASGFEYFNILGIGLFLYLNNFKDPDMAEKWKPYSVDALRICIGVALISLGINEKLSGAALGQTFVSDYGWNFMTALGFEMFDDRLFVLSAGISEVIIGIIVLFGTTTRIIVVTTAALMLTSNIVFILQGENMNARTELVGHLPIIGSALVLILLGYGQRLKITNLFGAKE